MIKVQQTKSSLLLILTALIWGIAFVAQSAGMEYVGPFSFNFARNLLGGITLLFYLALAKRKRKRESDENRELNSWTNPRLWIGGVCCGTALFAASTLQQFGIQETTVGKAGFITALYIVMVPILSLFFGKRAAGRIWVSVGTAVAGMYLLCMSGPQGIGKGDVLVLLCAVVFSVHILVIDHFSPLADGVKMSCIQFFVCSLLSLPGMILMEEPSAAGLMSAWLPIAYAGVLSSGVGYTLQILGQKSISPAVASLILSLESVFSALAGWLILGQRLAARELFGCVLIFGAILLAQMPSFAGQRVSDSH